MGRKKASLDEWGWVDRAIRGDPEGFRYLYRKYVAAVFRFVRAQVSNHQDAEDLTAETFLRAWKAMPKYQHRGHPFSAFLFRIARNLVIDFRRKFSEEIVEFNEDFFSTRQASDQTLFEDYEILAQAIHRLPEDYRQVIALRFFGDLTVRETALVMGRSEAATRVLQHRAIRKLRQIMENTTEKNAL